MACVQAPATQLQLSSVAGGRYGFERKCSEMRLWRPNDHVRRTKCTQMAIDRSQASTPPGLHGRQYLVSRGRNVLPRPNFVKIIIKLPAELMRIRCNQRLRYKQDTETVNERERESASP